MRYIFTCIIIFMCTIFFAPSKLNHKWCKQLLNTLSLAGHLLKEQHLTENLIIFLIVFTEYGFVTCADIRVIGPVSIPSNA